MKSHFAPVSAGDSKHYSWLCYFAWFELKQQQQKKLPRQPREHKVTHRILVWADVPSLHEEEGLLITPITFTCG